MRTSLDLSSEEYPTATALVNALPDLFQQIVETADEGIWIHDLNGRTSYANAGMASLMGYSISEMYQVTLFDLLDDDGKPQALGMLERERVTPLTEEVDCRYLRKDGSAVWCLVNRSPLYDGSGNHLGSVNLVSDITDRKRLDDSLRRNSDLLAEAQRVAHLGSWGWLVTEDLIDWSDEMFSILGLDRTGDQLTLQSYLDQVHPDDRPRVIADITTGAEGAPSFTYNCRIVRPDGEVRWIHAEGTTTKDATGAVATMRGTMMDITPYQLAMQEVERTAARYQLLQRMATEANRDTGFEQVLRLAVSEITSHTRWSVGRVYLVSGEPAQLADQPLTAAHPGPDAAPPEPDRAASLPATALPLQVLLTGRSVWAEALVFRDPLPPSQEPRPVSGFAFPVLAGDEIVAVAEFLSDTPAVLDQQLLETCEQVGHQVSRVLQRERAADELAAARDAAMESLRVKSEFLATMSHEIRTPMNGVIGLTNLLLDTRLDERQRQYAEGVQVSGEALLTVINDILDFSKLEAGKVDLDYEDFDVRRLVDEVAALLAPTAYGKSLELLAYCLPEVPPVLVGDSGRIRQILLNLVSNGVKFTSAGEVVTRVTCSPLARPKPGAPSGSVSLRFEVRDTGIGIAEQSRAKMFESFSQADASTTRRYGGTGLGLAISQRLVGAMGGTIGFESEVGTGSTFWFEIPLERGRALPHLTPSVLPGLLDDLRVLVVDDNATNRMILESQLRSWHLQPDVVDSAAAALVQMREMVRRDDPYAIAVLDMCMPDVSGLELAEQISADEELSSTQMIMLTSTSELDPTDLSGAGVAEWLLKPVRTTDLYDRLLRLRAPQARTHSSASSAEHPITAPDPSATPAESLGRVLVVEDNPLNQLVAQGMVESIGYSVDIVSNGAEALLAVLNTSYAAVLMDCHMPVLDGFEATQEIRRREGEGQRMPIIAMTAGAMADDRARCVAAGMDGFVSKPVTLAAVESALAHWIHPSHDIPLLPESTSRPTLPDGRGQEPWGDQPALDLNRIAQLRQLGTMGGTDLLGRVTSLFLRDGKTSLAAIREASTADRVGDLGHELHKLKGTASNLGAARVAALCAQLEDETREEPADGPPGARGPLLAPEQLDELELELDRADQAIREAV